MPSISLSALKSLKQVVPCLLMKVLVDFLSIFKLATISAVAFSSISASEYVGQHL